MNENERKWTKMNQNIKNPVSEMNQMNQMNQNEPKWTKMNETFSLRNKIFHHN